MFLSERLKSEGAMFGDFFGASGMVFVLFEIKQRDKWELCENERAVIKEAERWWLCCGENRGVYIAQLKVSCGPVLAF